MRGKGVSSAGNKSPDNKLYPPLILRESAVDSPRALSRQKNQKQSLGKALSFAAAIFSRCFSEQYNVALPKSFISGWISRSTSQWTAIALYAT